MHSHWLIWNAVINTARLSTVLQVLLFLPLTLSTLSTSAFLVLSLILTLHSIFHSTINVFFPVLQPLLPFLQVPLHPFFLILVFNLFSNPLPSLLKAANVWGTLLRWFTPGFVLMEGLASLVVIQSTGKRTKAWTERRERGDEWQFALLVAAAVAYVFAAWVIVITYPSAATTPLSSTLLGAALTALIFLTLIGFALRRTNVIETSGMALYLAYNVWLCSEAHESDKEWLQLSTAYLPLLSNLLPHLESLLSFITHTIPRPVLIALLYRLTILHFASGVLPTIGADSWAEDAGVDNGWEERPSSKLTSILLAYRQTILVTTYSHLLLLDHSSQVWWRWTNVFFTLITWAVDFLIMGEEAGLGKDWKVE